ncbi:MAG: hypothetical protein BRC32_02700 [Actinobacteria bacterium QS_8_72_14]|nr:MAG: hypothetical protein BRC32_02700 [Actinobacteria bacterium QS_8_72_14]
MMKLSTWARQVGLHPRTAYRWFHAGALPVPARQLAAGTILVEPTSSDAGEVAVYARGSSADQRSDLDRQVARLAAERDVWSKAYYIDQALGVYIRMSS